MSAEARGLLLEMFNAAVGAAHPSTCLAPHLPPAPTKGRLIVLCAGKAAIAMASVAEAHYRQAGDRLVGLATAPHGYAAAFQGQKPTRLEILEGRHPTPDASSLAAAERALALAQWAGPDDTVLVLLSGGASALWAAPAAGLDLAEKTALTRGLLKSGADIHEMNVVRRHLSRIKGGRLRAAAAKAGTFITLAISDVPGDDPETIGSGPTVPDPTTLADARATITRRGPRMAELELPVPQAVLKALGDAANETPKPGDALFSHAHDRYQIIATPVAALDAAAALARAHGYDVRSLGDQVTGEARDIAGAHARLAREARGAGRRLAIISGGELEVTVRNKNGRGGRSQEYALALACALDGLAGVAALAADTDGIDGGDGRITDPAGAVIGPDTLIRARERHADARNALDNNDATTLFEALGDLVHTGPTHTNVNDFRVILVEPA